MPVATLGPAGTHSERAARSHDPEADILFADSIVGVFDLVEGGEAPTGVVPVENSTEGVVTQTLDLLMESELRVVGEVETEVHHHLIGEPEPETIISHPQALAQCRRHLRSHHPEAGTRTVESTAKAVEEAAETEGAAAIGSEESAEERGLSIAEREIQDVEGNRTRFAVIGRDEPEATGRDKTTIAFFVKDKPGALYHALGIFYRHGVNLTMLESRPSREGFGDYYFYADLQGHVDDPEVSECLEELRKEVRKVEVLGSYPRA